MYIAFIFSFTELTTAIPQAGGPFAYAYRAFGPWGGAIAGFATLIEFVFAPPAISLAIGAYLAVQFPSLDPRTAALGAYAIFVALNIVGVGIAATFELFVTILAVAELRCSLRVAGRPHAAYENEVPARLVRQASTRRRKNMTSD